MRHIRRANIRSEQRAWDAIFADLAGVSVKRVSAGKPKPRRVVSLSSSTASKSRRSRAARSPRRSASSTPSPSSRSSPHRPLKGRRRRASRPFAPVRLVGGVPAEAAGGVVADVRYKRARAAAQRKRRQAAAAAKKRSSSSHAFSSRLSFAGPGVSSSSKAAAARSSSSRRAKRVKRTKAGVRLAKRMPKELAHGVLADPRYKAAARRRKVVARARKVASKSRSGSRSLPGSFGPRISSSRSVRSPPSKKAAPRRKKAAVARRRNQPWGYPREIGATGYQARTHRR